MKKGSKLIMLFSVLCISVSFVMPCFATVTINSTERNDVDMTIGRTVSVPDTIKNILPSTDEQVSTTIGYDFRAVLDGALDNGLMHISENGELEFSSDTTTLISWENYNDFSYRIQLLNTGIALGVISFSEENKQLTELDMTKSENMEMVQANARELWSSPEKRREQSNAVLLYAASSHGCGYQYLNVGQLTASNRQTVIDFYETYLAYEPDGNARGATTGYWVGMVMEGGPWDYKRDPSIGPYDHRWCCSYWRLSNQHRTAEWLGNYNYGYTGSFLFSLDVLKKGSYAASGFKNEDYSDWDAIEEGYIYSGGK